MDGSQSNGTRAIFSRVRHLEIHESDTGIVSIAMGNPCSRVLSYLGFVVRLSMQGRK